MNASKKRGLDRASSYADLRALADWPSSADVDYADSVLRAEYYGGTVKGVAESMIEEIKRGEIADSGALSDRLHEDCDGHHDVIYTACARTIVYVSDYSSDAHEEWFGDLGGKEYKVEAIAFLCLKHDAEEEIDRLLNEQGFGGVEDAIEHYTREVECAHCGKEIRWADAVGKEIGDDENATLFCSAECNAKGPAEDADESRDDNDETEGH